MKALFGCEESQAVCKEFRAIGFEAYSCDIKPCSGGHPEWHIQGDIFHTLHKPEFLFGLDFLGCHPPCTYSANSGVRWLYNRDGSKNLERWKQMRDGALFAKSLLANIERVGMGYLEQPILHKHALEIIGRKPDQIIQPWQFGHGEMKATCLWLVNLPKLEPSEIVEGREQRIWKLPPDKKDNKGHRAALRAKTFPGIAKAMADQWGKLFQDIDR
jgi:hypothetical protein